jgi:hypothetical protein
MDCALEYKKLGRKQDGAPSSEKNQFPTEPFVLNAASRKSRLFEPPGATAEAPNRFSSPPHPA